MPFCTVWERDTHFAKHGQKVGAVDAADYERMADEFMFGARQPGTGECIRRKNGDRLRFNRGTRYLCVSRVLPVPECVRTFYEVEQAVVRHHRGTNTYFRHECDRMDL